MTTREELARAVGEAIHKSRTLHESRLKAHQEMLDAQARYAFLVRACDQAAVEESSARHALEADIRKEAYEVTREADAERFYRAGGCPTCGSPPGMPCDAVIHS